MTQQFQHHICLAWWVLASGRLAKNDSQQTAPQDTKQKEKYATSYVRSKIICEHGQGLT